MLQSKAYTHSFERPSAIERLQTAVTWLFGPEPISEKRPGHLWPRWIFLRALGLIYFSAFYSLLFQIKGLIGTNGLLPASDYLQAVTSSIAGVLRFWFAPTLLWISAGNRALMAICWVGLIASVILVLNVWPRGMLVVCFVSFLSFVAAAQDFSGYQSDGMLLEAGFISLFFAAPGFWPGLGRGNPPSRASMFLLQWEWFRIYFESGVAKIRSGDPSWRNYTAMDNYYQNGPLPTWIGWYVQHFPHWFHAATVVITLGIELVLVWMLFLPRRFRIVCFCIVTPFEIGIILTANYTFLNYLVLSLGFLLLDDRFVEWVLPRKAREFFKSALIDTSSGSSGPASAGQPVSWRWLWRERLRPLRMAIAGAFLGLIFYATTAQLLWMFVPTLPLPTSPISALEPSRIANRYGLFAVMTPDRLEIEFQGTNDGKTWIPYPFRYKPQDLNKAPGIYAPYQPRFDWNLWFASLGSWRDNRFVIWTQERLLKSEPDVLYLFVGNPFAGKEPPVAVRSVIYQYWFTDEKTKRETGNWWRRELLGAYAPALERQPDGRIGIVDLPIARPSRE
ncbi:MAG TPA: lipase maturation factor family protein [Candidatus Acidoferrum sp.]|nr:lipase maturation factor family protein [Candidatus Acidoferrum sp.]